MICTKQIQTVTMSNRKNERLTMKKAITLSLAAILFLQPVTISASGSQLFSTSIEKWNPYHIEHLEAYDFSTIYPKAIYQKSYFGWLILATTIVVAGTVSYLTAGAGAPAAASGVSTVATVIGGGGPGSYMAGLSTVGSLVGGNAMVGAAILNGLSIGTIGTGSTTTLSMATKAALLTDIALSGMTLTASENSQNLYYLFDIPLPEDLGSGKVRRLVNTIYNDQEERADALEEGDMLKNAKMGELIEDRYAQGVYWLEKELNKKITRQSQENLLILGIMAYKMGYIDLFGQSLEQIDKLDALRLDKPSKRSFLNYLIGVYTLSSIQPDTRKALDYFEKSYREEPSAIEPYLATIMILGDDFKTNHKKIESLIKEAAENYDEDKYSGRSSLVSLYFKAGTLFLRHHHYEKAAEYFERAYDSLGFLIKHLPISTKIKNAIQIQWAMALKHFNQKQSDAMLKDILERSDNLKEREELRQLYERDL